MAENVLRAQEERFRIGAQTSSDVLYEWDIATGALLLFGQIDEKLGYDPGEMPHHITTWEKLAHPEDRDRVREAVIRHMKTGAPYREEYRVVGKYGSVHVWMDSGQALRDASGRPVRWIGVVTDVTERRMMEWALKQSDQRLRMLVGNAPVVLFAIDRDGVFTHSEGKGLEALGLKPGEAVGRSIHDLYRGVPEVSANLERALAGETFTAIVEVEGLAFEAQYGPFRGPSGEIIGVIGVATDVTERQRARQAALASEQRYRGSSSATWPASSARRSTAGFSTAMTRSPGFSATRRARRPLPTRPGFLPDARGPRRLDPPPAGRPRPDELRGQPAPD